MTDEPSARDIAKQIVREYQPYAYPSWADGLTARIESALLSHGRRERARGMREGGAIALDHISSSAYPTRSTAIEAIEHHARETEGTI